MAKTKILTARVPPALAAAVDARCREASRSRTDLLREVIAAGLASVASDAGQPDEPDTQQTGQPQIAATGPGLDALQDWAIATGQELDDVLTDAASEYLERRGQPGPSSGH